MIDTGLWGVGPLHHHERQHQGGQQSGPLLGVVPCASQGTNHRTLLCALPLPAPCVAVPPLCRVAAPACPRGWPCLWPWCGPGSAAPATTPRSRGMGAGAW